MFYYSKVHIFHSKSRLYSGVVTRYFFSYNGHNISLNLTMLIYFFLYLVIYLFISFFLYLVIYLVI